MKFERFRDFQTVQAKSENRGQENRPPRHKQGAMAGSTLIYSSFSSAKSKIYFQTTLDFPFFTSPITYVGTLCASMRHRWILSAALLSTINVKPMPMLKTVNISSSSMSPCFCNQLKMGGTGQ